MISSYRRMFAVPLTTLVFGLLACFPRTAVAGDEAIALYEQVRDVQLKKLGSEHADTLTTLNNLAGAYQNAGRTAEAIELYERVRDVQMKKLGSDHADTLATLNNLALACKAAGRTAEAITVLERVRDVQIKKVGSDDTATLTTLSNLALAYKAAGRKAEAITMLERVRDVQVKKLGSDHPDTLTTLSNLAQVYKEPAKVLPLLERVSDTPTDEPQQLSRFRALQPSERLKFIEKLTEGAIQFAAAKRDDLVVTVAERGATEPATFVDVICNLKAIDNTSNVATTIKWLIEEGSVAKKGDRLALLDDSAIRVRLLAAAAKVKEAEAALIRATDNARVAKLENEVVVRVAEIDINLIEVELKDLPQGKARQTLELKIEQAKLKLELTRLRGKTRQEQAIATVQFLTAALALETQAQRNIEAELKQCELTSPVDGVVALPLPTADEGGGKAARIAVGESVREGQKLLRVGELKQFAIAARVVESQISTVRVGQSAELWVDAMPGQRMVGKVTQISTVAGANDGKAKTKSYPVVISIDDPAPRMRSGLSGDVKITTGELKRVLQVPVKSVVSIGKDRLCFVKSGQELIERKVVTGASNATSIEITEGLKEDDQVVADLSVLLVRP